MNAADLARLEIAKRAYTAAQPNATEVQTGVRRARLSLRRVKSRRTWFGKGLVLVVLAVGSLAYAKPHALGELVENLTHTSGAGSVKRGGNGVSVPSPVASPVATSVNAAAMAPSLDVAPAAIEPALHESDEQAPRAVSSTTASAPSQETSEGAASAAHVAASAAHVAASAVKGAASAAHVAASRAQVAMQASQTPPAPAAVSDWGRVAQALASGDETKALSALSELSESDDQRTRDKADLGRAQLFIAHGDSDKGCALVRSLSNRRAGSHIERQAQLLLKSCTR